MRTIPGAFDVDLPVEARRSERVLQLNVSYRSNRLPTSDGEIESKSWWGMSSAKTRYLSLSKPANASRFGAVGGRVSFHRCPTAASVTGHTSLKAASENSDKGTEPKDSFSN